MTRKIPEVFNPSEDAYPRGNKRLLLLGPPGTGKTRAAIEYFLLPALTGGIAPDKILSCSFTRAAAKELRERLAKPTGLSVKNLRESCSTIHSEALRIFRKQFEGQSYTIIGADKDSTDEDEGSGPASRFFEDSLPKSGDHSLKEGLALRVWDYARNSLVTDITSLAFSEIVKDICGTKVDLAVVRDWVLKYEKSKRDNRRLDFNDILIAAIRCPAPDRELLIIDEAQDCSLLQWKLLEKWITKSNHVAFIGDIDQCLYIWNASRPEKLLELADSGYLVRRLGQSFRVPSKVHAVARKLILKNKDRIDAPYLPMDKEGSIEELSHHSACSELSEAIFDEDRDAFVLARSSKILQNWAESLSERGIPFVNERGKSPWGSPIALSVARAVMAIREGQPIAITDAKRFVESLPGRHKEYFGKGVTKVRTSESLANSTKLSLMSQDLESLGLLMDRIKTVELETIFTELGLEDRAYSIKRVIDNLGSDVLYTIPRIRLTTMHASKGREADIVVVDMEMSGATMIAVKKDPSTIDAERRLVYVSLTRTKDSLIMVRNGKYDLAELVGLADLI